MPAACRRFVSDIIMSCRGIFFPYTFVCVEGSFPSLPITFFLNDFGAMSIPVLIIPCSTFFFATCLRTLPSLGVGIETREFSALFFDILNPVLSNPKHLMKMT